MEYLAEFYKQVQKLDSAGRTLLHVFEEKGMANQREAFRNWLINLEIWGTFYPLNAQCYDIYLTRISSYAKLVQIRRGIKYLNDEKRSIIAS